MDISAPGALAVELHPHSPTQWIAIYYPLVATPAGRWADVTGVLHQRLMPLTAPAPLEPAGGWRHAASTPLTPATPATAPGRPNWWPATRQH